MIPKGGTQRTAVNRAYVLIETEAESKTEVARALRQTLDIPMVDIVNGPYPVIAVVEGGTISAMAKTIAVDIRKLGGVKDVVVYMSSSAEEVASGNQETSD